MNAVLIFAFAGTRAVREQTERRRERYQRCSDTDKRDNWLAFIIPCHFSSIYCSLGVKESDTGLASPNLWDLAADRQRMGEEHPLQVARCTKIIPKDPVLAEAAKALNPQGAAPGQKGADEQDKYVINIKQIAKFVVGLGDRVAATDIEEGMRVGLVILFVTTEKLP